MADLVIEGEVLIETPVEVVWRTITEPDPCSNRPGWSAGANRVGRFFTK